MVMIRFRKGRSGGGEFLSGMKESRDGIEGEEDRLERGQVSGRSTPSERAWLREEKKGNYLISQPARISRTPSIPPEPCSGRDCPVEPQTGARGSRMLARK